MAYTGEPNWGVDNNQDYWDQQNKQGYYEKPTAEQFAQQANQFRQIYEEPQRNALTRQLEQAISDAQSQEQKINANYMSYHNAMRNREQQQRGQDLESAISRGAGRSGVVNYMDQKRDQFYTGEMSSVEAQKMAELNALSNELRLVNKQVPRELIELAEQASRLEAQELQRLRDLSYERGAQYDQDMFARSLNVFDRTKLTPLEQLQLYLSMADVAGKFPAKAPSASGT